MRQRQLLRLGTFHQLVSLIPLAWALGSKPNGALHEFAHLRSWIDCRSRDSLAYRKPGIEEIGSA
jgi:hypothetical protein